MHLTVQQRAALASALSHPQCIITASNETATALERRGLVVDRRLTPIGIDVANGLGGNFCRCADCGKSYPSMRTLPTTERDICPPCIKRLCSPITAKMTASEQRAKWSRKYGALHEDAQNGIFGDTRSWHYR